MKIHCHNLIQMNLQIDRLNWSSIFNLPSFFRRRRAGVSILILKVGTLWARDTLKPEARSRNLEYFRCVMIFCRGGVLRNEYPDESFADHTGCVWNACTGRPKNEVFVWTFWLRIFLRLILHAIGITGVNGEWTPVGKRKVASTILMKREDAKRRCWKSGDDARVNTKEREREPHKSRLGDC